MAIRLKISVLLVPLLFIGCGMCHNAVVSELRSPGGTYRAVLFQRDCGATTGFSTQVSVYRSWWPSSQSAGNVFAATGGEIPASWRGPWARLKWIDNSTLEVAYDKSANVFGKETKVHGVAIRYVELSDV